MTTRLFEVYLGERAIRVGVLRFEQHGARQHSTFSYDDTWGESSEAFAISPTMPLSQRTFFTHRGSNPHANAFPGAFADTCPDAWGRAILARDGSTKGHPLNDADLIAGVDDATRLGALRLREKGGAFVRASFEGRPITPPLIALGDLMAAARAIETKTDTQKDVDRLLGNGSSLGGARPKCNVVLENGTLAIAKFTRENDGLPVERAEVATLRLAKACGLRVSDARLIEVAGSPVALISRFDRGADGRIPFISAQTMLDLEEATDGTYEQMVEAIRTHGNDAQKQTEELFERVAFTILVNNVDDHQRNHGFVHTGHGRWWLSPAFDINPSPDSHRRLKTRIADDLDDTASLEALVSKSQLFGLDPTSGRVRITAMSGRIQKEWPRHAKEAGMSRREIEAFEPAFKHPDIDR